MNKTRAHAAEVIIGAMACYYTLLALFFYRNYYYTSRQYNEQSGAMLYGPHVCIFMYVATLS